MNEPAWQGSSPRDWRPPPPDSKPQGGSIPIEPADSQPQPAEPLSPDDSTSPGPAADDLRSTLAGVQTACSDLTARLTRAYRELTAMDERVRRQESEVGRREDAAARVLADAEREAATLIEQARHEETQLRARAEGEAEQASQRSRTIERQMAQRLAALALREEELRDREGQIAETARQQTAEREWLNHYAQTLHGVAAELERALDEVEDGRRSRADNGQAAPLQTAAGARGG